MPQHLQQLRALMNLNGVTRKEAAAALYLSTSALNRKLRGEIALTKQEQEALLHYVTTRRKPTP